MACACRTLPSNGMMIFIAKSCISADRLVVASSTITTDSEKRF